LRDRKRLKTRLDVATSLHNQFASIYWWQRGCLDWHQMRAHKTKKKEKKERKKETLAQT